MRQKIELDAKGKVNLAKTFGVTVQNVSQALLFRRNSVQAHKIREAAKEMGGRVIEMRDVTAPRTVKFLNSKGEVVRARVIEDTITL